MSVDVEAVHSAAQRFALAATVPQERLDDPACANAFLLRHGRMPMLDKGEKPWTYRGWLRLMVQLVQRHGQKETGFPDRWGYLFAIHSTRKLPGPIPQVDFGAAHPSTYKATSSWLDALEKGTTRWDSYRTFLRFLAYGLDVGKQSAVNLPDTVAEELYRTVDIGQWLKHPSDYLGEIAAERYGGGPDKFFPTPHDLCDLKVALLMSEADALSSVNDPAMGSGRMLLHASNKSLFLSGQDIDEGMWLATYINLAIYAPWGVYPPTVLEKKARPPLIVRNGKQVVL